MSGSFNLLPSIHLLVALTGVMVAVLGWRGITGNRSRWCPSCDADLSGTQARKCDGCGYSSTDEASFHQPRRRWWIVITGLSVVSVSSMFAVGWDLPSRSGRLMLSEWIQVDVRDLPYDWKVERMIPGDPDRAEHTARIRLMRDGETYLDWRGVSGDLGFRDPRTARRVGLGTDLDRDGTPDLVLRVASTAGDRTEWMLLSLADRKGSPRVQPTTVLVDGSFMDVDDDGRFEFVAEDATLRNRWIEPSRFSGPSIVMSPSGTGWRFDASLSHGRPIGFDPDEDPLEPLVEARRAWEESRRPFITELFDTAFALTSRGRHDAALALLAEAWPGDEEPESVATFLTLEEASTPRSYRPYRADPAWRADLFTEMLDNSRFADEFARRSPTGIESD